MSEKPSEFIPGSMSQTQEAKMYIVTKNKDI